MHSIHIDHKNILVDMRLSGFFTPEAAMAAVEDLRTAVRSLGTRAGQHVTLYDVSAVEVAPAATIELLKQSYTDPAIRALWARRIAYCTPSALARLQVARLREARPDIGVFTDRESAIAWLLAGDEIGAADRKGSKTLA